MLIVGAGTHFLSAMTYYTYGLTNALASKMNVAFIPMRQLIPTFLYPGRGRVGSTTTQLECDPGVKELKGIDWYWVPSLFRDLRYLRKWKPEVVIFQWWSGSMLHTYLIIALLAKLQGASIIIEVHEILDTGEQRIPLARAWVWALGRPFFGLATAFVIHSESDREPLGERYAVGTRPCVIIPHGPSDLHVAKEAGAATAGEFRSAPAEALNLLFFGLIRPYKGLEDLVQAFDMLDEDELGSYWLTIVGETWEGWDLPIKLIEDSPHRHRISLINRWVSDDEVIGFFAGADAVILPYHRSSASSPAHVAMSNGLPLVITNVGGLPAAVGDYEGAIQIPPNDPTAIRDAIRQLPSMRGHRYKDPHTWDRSVSLYQELITELRNPSGATA